jgi:outer membrane protein assembly factor BamB
MGLLMNQIGFKKNKKFILPILCIMLLIVFTQCGGLVKLAIPEEAYFDTEDIWLMPNKNERRQHTFNQDVFPPYKIQWSKKYKSVITDHPLAVDKFLIYTVKSGMLVMVDTELEQLLGDGRIAAGVNHSPILDKNILYFSANLGNDTMGAFDVSNKKLLWLKKLPYLNTTPLLKDNRLLVGANNGQFFALNKDNGDELWNFKAQSAIFGNPAGLGDKLFFGDVQGNFYCLNVQTGRKIWETKISENVYAGPILSEDLVIIGSTAGILHALSIKNGEEEWTQNTRGSIYGNAACREGIIYLGNNAHKFFAIRSKDGSILWEFETKGINNSPPLVGLKLVYFGSWDGNFYILDRESGELIHKQEFDKPIKSSPIIYNHRLYIHTANHRLYCLANGNNY